MKDKKTISTSDLNKFLEKITKKYPPPSENGKFLKLNILHKLVKVLHYLHYTVISRTFFL